MRFGRSFRKHNSKNWSIVTQIFFDCNISACGSTIYATRFVEGSSVKITNRIRTEKSCEDSHKKEKSYEDD